MSRIEKKAWPAFFQAVLEGTKSFDLRLADFACNPGDTLVLREWDPETEAYSGRSVEKVVSYVLKTKELPFWTREETERHGFQVIAFRQP